MSQAHSTEDNCLCVEVLATNQTLTFGRSPVLRPLGRFVCGDSLKEALRGTSTSNNADHYLGSGMGRASRVEFLQMMTSQEANRGPMSYVFSSAEPIY